MREERLPEEVRSKFSPPKVYVWSHKPAPPPSVKHLKMIGVEAFPSSFGELVSLDYCYQAPLSLSSLPTTL